ncbi:unnamed protein product [Acanthoscelides obtectus]|uniref:Uncharacterized protein n=1 Tax=Acanthoscelides obtectus TaxID=200917 RepID=A0A9P0Q6Q5_ACAOB|nr:unnamed protein product [Acanthoscelides obtectus]CAK1629966.1 hypothetical protein AOBTE_LOCUS6067 [Acanthoscelides obtectus]
MPVITQPELSVSWNKWVIVPASMSLSGIFLWVTQQAVSTPFTATEVRPAWFIALKAYSTWYNLPSGEKIVMCLSKPALLPRDMLEHYFNESWKPKSSNKTG